MESRCLTTKDALPLSRACWIHRSYSIKHVMLWDSMRTRCSSNENAGYFSPWIDALYVRSSLATHDHHCMADGAKSEVPDLQLPRKASCKVPETSPIMVLSQLLGYRNRARHRLHCRSYGGPKHIGRGDLFRKIDPVSIYRHGRSIMRLCSSKQIRNAALTSTTESLQ